MSCWTLITSFKKRADAANDTRAVNGIKEDATDTGIFFIEEYQHNATTAVNIPRHKPVVMILTLNKLIADLFVKNAKTKSIVPP